MDLQIVRCSCKKLLAKASGSAVIELVCPRCGACVRVRLEAGAVTVGIKGKRVA